VAALSPGGLWRRSGFLQIGAAMRLVRLGARTIRRLTPDAPRTRLARGLFTAQASGHPFKVPYEQARTAADAMAAAPGFRETLRAAERRRFRDGEAIRVPVTIAFGSRDWALVPVVARRRKELPGHARWVKLPGLGHIPMLDDPETVARLLLETSQPAGSAA
jgi:pimeloyl-ACP methyl ester carboxylesterase